MQGEAWDPLSVVEENHSPWGCAFVTDNAHLKLMNELLNLAVHAHGGLERWKKVKAIKVAASITGAIWFVKGKGDYLKNVVLTVDTTKERLTVDFPGLDKRSIFEPKRVVNEKSDGTLIEARYDPEKSFEGQQRETP